MRVYVCSCVCLRFRLSDTIVAVVVCAHRRCNDCHCCPTQAPPPAAHVSSSIFALAMHCSRNFRVLLRFLLFSHVNEQALNVFQYKIECGICVIQVNAYLQTRKVVYYIRMTMSDFCNDCKHYNWNLE